MLSIMVYLQILVFYNSLTIKQLSTKSKDQLKASYEIMKKIRKFLITEKRQWTYHGPFFIDLQEIGRRKSSDVISVIFISK